MKKAVVTLLLLVMIGCSSEKVQSYLSDPGTLLQDPLSVNHQKALDELEGAYLRKEMTYAEYLQKKKQLEEDYSRAATARKNIIETQP